MTLSKGKALLNSFEHWALVEALRRRTRFDIHCGDRITRQWTGLGCATTYNAAVKSGLMEVATSLNPGHSTWWRLTEKGARVVCYWIGAGYDYQNIEDGRIPPAQIPQTIL